MSQIHLNNGGIDLSHYEKDHGLLKNTEPTLVQQLGEAQKAGKPQVAGRLQPSSHIPPAELIHARPAQEDSSRWSAGRVAACIFTCGISELLRLAWRGIMACCSSSRPAPAPEPRTAGHNAKGIPDALPEADSFNENVGLRLLGSKPLPDDLEDAARDALAELRKKFGEELVPEGKPLKTTLGGSAQMLYSLIKKESSEVTPARIREWVLLCGKTNIIKKALADKMKEFWPDHVGKFPVALPDYALLRHPELKERLLACDSPENIREALESFEPGLQSIINQKQQLDGLINDARFQYAEALSKGLGAQNMAVSDMEFRPFNVKAQRIADAILTGTHPGCKEEGFDAAKALRNFALEQADIRISEYESIMHANISDDLKNTFRHMMLTNESVKQGSLATYVELGRKVDASRLMEILSAPEPDQSAIKKELLALGKKLNDAFMAHFGPEKWHDMDGDVKANYRAYAPLVMLDKVPGLRKALADYPALDELSQWCAEQMDTEDHPEYGISIANIAGIAKFMISSAGEVDLRLQNLAQLGG